MDDFTSSLYLGMHHGSGDLPRWRSLTTGRPALLGGPPLTRGTAAALARLLGLPHAVLTRSTTHALADCVEDVVRPGTLMLVDAGTYAVGQRAAALAAGRGATVVQYAHHDASALERLLPRRTATRARVVVLADGFCASCGKGAPLRRYLRSVRDAGALLVLDDTQAVGVLGARPTRQHPYGLGGGGSLRFYGERPGNVLVVASLAKAFGAPLAVVAGDGPAIGRLSRSGSAVHASPPTVVDLLAAEAALSRNAAEGTALRDRLLHLVRTLRGWTERQWVPGPPPRSLRLRAGDFPVQATPALPRDLALAVQARLSCSGVRAVVGRVCGAGDRAAVVLVVTTDHSQAAVERAGVLLATALQDDRHVA